MLNLFNSKIQDFFFFLEIYIKKAFNCKVYLKIGCLPTQAAGHIPLLRSSSQSVFVLLCVYSVPHILYLPKRQNEQFASVKPLKGFNPLKFLHSAQSLSHYSVLTTKWCQKLIPLHKNYLLFLFAHYTQLQVVVSNLELHLFHLFATDIEINIDPTHWNKIIFSCSIK